MRKLAIYEFGCRNILYLMFELLSIYCLYQKRFVETISYSKKVKPSMTDDGEICGHLNLRFINRRKISRVIRPIKFGISICACCCNMLACVVSDFLFHQTFPHSNFVIWLLFFYQSTHVLAH